MKNRDKKGKDNSLKPPEKDEEDIAYTLVKACLSAIPVVGGPVTELSSLIKQSPIEREWRSGENLLHKN